MCSAQTYQKINTTYGVLLSIHEVSVPKARVKNANAGPQAVVIALAFASLLTEAREVGHEEKI